MTTTNHLVTRDDPALVRVDPQALIAQAIERGAGIETLERLVALAKEVKADLARDRWYAAMATFQRTCPPIKKTKTVRTRQYSYTYAPLDEILSTVQPVLGSVGLSVSWKVKTITETEVSVSCVIAHEMGHTEESGDFVIPIKLGQLEGSGPNAAQRVGVALSYAKRYALLGVIGLAPEDDDDAERAEAPFSGLPPVDPGHREGPPARPEEATGNAPAEWEVIANDYIAVFDQSQTRDEAEEWRLRWTKIKHTLPEAAQAPVAEALARARARLRTA